MTANIDLLRVYADYSPDWPLIDRQTVLDAAMPDVPALRLTEAWDAVADLIAAINHLDSRVALDQLKEQGRIGGGTDPQAAYDLVLGELEQQIQDVVRGYLPVRRVA